MMGWLAALVQLLGLLAAVKAVMEARTAQGAVAWAVALVGFPLVSLPLFLVFGQSRVRDYVQARRRLLAASPPRTARAQAALARRDLANSGASGCHGLTSTGCVPAASRSGPSMRSVPA